MAHQKMPVTFGLVACAVLVILWDPVLVDGEPDPMARPTRPKVFTSAEELRRYLDLVRDYYSLSGKARYGKRAQILPVAESENPWELLRIPYGQQQQQPLQRFPPRHELPEQFHQMDNPTKLNQFQRDIQNQQQQQQQQQQGEQQKFLFDILAKYYEDLQ